MKLIPIKATCYSGFKADENPKSFVHGNHKFMIGQIMDRWYQADLNPEIPATDYFKVETTCGLQFILKHEINPDGWFVCLSGFSFDTEFHPN